MQCVDRTPSVGLRPYPVHRTAASRAGRSLESATATTHNPDIVDYIGHGEVHPFYRTPGCYRLIFTGRLNARTGKGAAQFDVSTPPLLGPMRAYLQIFSGYGESLIDYNWQQTTIGVGVALNDLFQVPPR
jgi:outer membrane phospholipase A